MSHIDFYIVCFHVSNQANSSPRDRQATSIQVHDIFGIEQLDVPNKLEQLCINYANERLQQHFIMTTTTINEDLPCLQAMQGKLVCKQYCTVCCHRSSCSTRYILTMISMCSSCALSL
jgi:Myosin head (motor domain)